MPLVSIITPSFNQGHFIQNNLESIAQQDHDFVEHIVVDGGSTDNTVSILEQTHYPHPKQLIWSSTPDGGQSNAINKGFSAAKGTIVGWLNSDDIYLPHAIHRIVDFFISHPKHIMVYGEAVWIDDQGSCLDRYPTQYPLTAHSLRERCPICQPSVFFRSNLLQEIGLLDENLITVMDYDYWIRVFKSFPDRIGYLSEYLACSRIHNDCKTVMLREKVYNENIELIHRHFHSVPGHWISSYIDEYLGNISIEPKFFCLPQTIYDFLHKSFPFVDSNSLEKLKMRLRADCRLMLMSDFINVNVSEDGWTGKSCIVTLRESKKFSYLIVEGMHERPVHESVVVTVEIEDIYSCCHDIRNAGKFLLRIPLDTSKIFFDFVKVRISCEPTFVPVQVTHDSTDERNLGIQILSLALIPR